MLGQCAGATTYRTVLNVDRGLSWEEALAMRDAYVAEVRTAGGAVDPLVGFHLFTTSKEIGKTGAPLQYLSSQGSAMIWPKDSELTGDDGYPDSASAMRYCVSTPLVVSYQLTAQVVKSISHASMACGKVLLLCAGHTYVILVILSKRNAIMRYRVLRPNNIFQPLVAAHMLRSNYKKVWRSLCEFAHNPDSCTSPKSVLCGGMLQCSTYRRFCC